MRAAIIARLAYPQRLIENGFLPRECHARQFYGANDGRCGSCRDRLECRWLNLMDETGSADAQSLHSLSELLGFAVEYVVIIALQQAHDPRSCECDNCQWVRESEALIASITS